MKVENINIRRPVMALFQIIAFALCAIAIASLHVLGIYEAVQPDTPTYQFLTIIILVIASAAFMADKSVEISVNLEEGSSLHSIITGSSTMLFIVSLAAAVFTLAGGILWFIVSAATGSL